MMYHTSINADSSNEEIENEIKVKIVKEMVIQKNNKWSGGKLRNIPPLSYPN
ncbi:hypothetical protein SAMN05216352_12039 [Alteribacillus bidgolensis]|uniref:Uncharacterized protein n=1 Tax=Alteribacillus bidgolensis TaxID=930129 RepID=A0A1G8QK86_9BACI|nr:hypothetical protein SAMN05216352_12039 [Alteribacillus bidgolensis]